MADTLENLRDFILIIVLVGMILGVSILTLDKFSTTNGVRDPRTETNESFTVNNSAFIGMVYQPIQSVTQVNNATNYSDTVASENLSFTTAGIKVTEVRFNGVVMDATYVYLENTTATDSLINSRNAIATISTDWLSLIITIAVLAIIVGLIVGAFAFRAR